MKIFVSWSGNVSHKVAEVLADWLPNVIQSVEAFLSSEMDKGVRWPQALAKELNETGFGVSVVTPDNISAPWLLFEAGAISKAIDDSFLAPLLFGVTKEQLNGSPLSQFQMTDFGRDEVLQLLQSINKANGENKLPEERVTDAFEKFWPELDKATKELLAGLSRHASQSSDTPEATAAADPPHRADIQNGGGDQVTDIRSINEPKAFEAALIKFEKSEQYKKDPQYWDATIADRRHRLGLPSSGRDLKSLASSHPDGFWPQYYLALQATSAGDHAAAAGILKEIGKPEREDQKKAVAELTVDVAYSSGGFVAGIEALRKLVLEVEEPFAAAAIEQLCAKKSEPKTRLAALVLRELGARYNPANANLKFNLALALAEKRGTSAIAFDHYTQLERDNQLKVNTAHNMAVIFTTRGLPALAADYYETSIQRGNVLSRNNQAVNLISSSFLKQAEDVLAPISDPGSWKLNIANTRASLEAARTKRGADHDALLAMSKEEHGRFSRFANHCATSWLGEPHPGPAGVWSSVDGRLTVSFSEGRSVAEIKVNNKTASGELASNGLCFEAVLVEPGGTAASGMARQMLLCFDRKGWEANALIWSDIAVTGSLEAGARVPAARDRSARRQ